MDDTLSVDAKTVIVQAIKVLTFLVLNYLLASAGFIAILFGVAFSLGSLTLCCVGVVLFQGLLYLAPVLIRLDIALHNFVEPMENKLYGHVPHYGESGTRSSLAVLLYFSTAKLGVGVLSAMVVVIPLSMPMHALMSPRFRAEYFCESWCHLTVFMMVATVLLVSGFVAMPHVIKLSCVTTRLFCREVYSSIYMHDYIPFAPEESLTTYGTNQSVEQV
ncbi:hypothetical protein KXD40_005406 [Peronospora effusa]|uniref:Uncharacterized protein n=1 Tax=Peronospora effusa TaxID=542832 RepID=A0A3M6VMJ8_9STRA|nr:hypothetical protein DD238_000532 [Peronospora effusa]UIZ27491.1 hypothetical protein KXD40_005406 [Peronospora effusa]